MGRKLVDREVVDREVVDREVVDREVVDGKVVDREVVDGEVVDKEVVDGEVVNGKVVDRKSKSSHCMITISLTHFLCVISPDSATAPLRVSFPVKNTSSVCAPITSTGAVNRASPWDPYRPRTWPRDAGRRDCLSTTADVESEANTMDQRSPTTIDSVSPKIYQMVKWEGGGGYGEGE